MFVSNAFATAPLLMGNQSIENGCTVSNVGAYSGTVAMVPHFAQLVQDASFQGACVYTNIGAYSGIINAVPQFQPASYNCAAGYYLPADAIACAECLPGATCAGGTYTYNATSDQGISCSGAIHYGRCHARCPKMSGEFHIGQYTHPLWADRADVPSPVIHIQFLDDNSMCYMYLTPDDVPVDEHHGFHIMYNDSPYRAINFGLYGLE